MLDIQTKCGDIANQLLNAAIDAERTFKCKWPKDDMYKFEEQEMKKMRPIKKMLWLVNKTKCDWKVRKNK